ncbi:prepilin-type N-terminal cleavage/methylation domain-containing protein [Dactylosporangium sp. NPDC000555]|uniref:competence type IV pilus major pilin ComGC n=1 Tax=Dactylosporangium sp. NPDC000555 TaxID=3154260 RepID=UPI0033313AED
MLQRLRAARENESGFTLVELLIVIVILGILAGIVVFAVGAFNDRGEKAACKADKKTVEVAVEAYRAQTGTYPAAGGWEVLTSPSDAAKRYLKEEPATNDKYKITLGANGEVTATGACS